MRIEGGEEERGKMENAFGCIWLRLLQRMENSVLRTQKAEFTIKKTRVQNEGAGARHGG